MLSITLLPQDEYRWTGENPSPATFPPDKGIYPLYHQWRTYNAEAPIIVNTYNTGTGKTKAALLRLLKRARKRGLTKLGPTNDNVLLIAPTNELLLQHAEGAQRFCDENSLPYRVLPLTKDAVEKYKGQQGFSEEWLRRGAALHYILNDPSRVDDDTEKRATIYVVNPDIFYYAIYFCYNRFDRGPLFDDFFRLFNYVIIDEFHYYDPKQFAAFLLFIKLSHTYIESPSKQRQFCILTATPRPQVKYYLEHLALSIEWIEPGNQHIIPEESTYVEAVHALTPVQLSVYSTEELQEGENSGGLLQLIAQKRAMIRACLERDIDGYKMEGAIISNSLGAISRIYQELLSTIPAEMMGRITGAELRGSRDEAKDKPLILATPTVDIGYNFERSQPKPRQNIDFLCFDAYSGDELVQRLGRAGRVLAKEQKEHISVVLAVVDQASYQILRPYHGQQLERSRLAELALEMPRKNDLYAYVKTGAIAEAFHPISFLKQGMSDQERVQLDTFFAGLRQFFAGDEDRKRRPYTYENFREVSFAFGKRQKFYGAFSIIPQEAFEKFPLLLEQRIPWEPASLKDARTQRCVETFYQRLEEASQRHEAIGKSASEACLWIQHDLSAYFKEKARFSFRESFQPPLALVSDPHHLHSASEVTTYTALHFVKYYHADFYETFEAWRERTGRSEALGDSVDTANVAAYCHLRKLRDEPRRIGLKLDATGYTQGEWEEQFAYQVTALYGLEVVIVNEHSGLKKSVRELFACQFIPAFIALNTSKSYTCAEIYRLKKLARFYPTPLEVTFCDGRCLSYHAILGTMAFHIYAEIPYWALVKDRRKTQLEDDAPIIC